MLGESKINMFIKLKCQNPDCAFTYCITEEEFTEYGEFCHSKCRICNSQLKVANLDEIVEKDLYTQAEQYINKWVEVIGWDNTLDLIIKNKNQSCYRIYKEILQKRGFKIND